MREKNKVEQSQMSLRDALRILDDPCIGLNDPLTLEAAKIAYKNIGAIEGAFLGGFRGNVVTSTGEHMSVTSDDVRVAHIPVMRRPGLLFLRIFDPGVKGEQNSGLQIIDSGGSK